MNFAKESYSYNADGSVRAEFITKENGVLPLMHFARLFGANIVNVFEWNKHSFRGFLLDAAFVNDDGIKCDAEHNPLEDEKFQPLPGKLREVWGQRCWVNRDGDRVLNDEEKSALSAEEQSDFRCLRCMEIKPESKDYNGDTIYVTEEATSVLAEVLRIDVSLDDPINKRYQYECQHDGAFADKFGYAMKEGQERLRKNRMMSHMAMCALDELFRVMLGDDENEPDKKEPDQPEKEEPDKVERSPEESES